MNITTSTRREINLPEFPGTLDARIDAYKLLGLTATSARIRTLAMERVVALKIERRSAKVAP